MIALTVGCIVVAAVIAAAVMVVVGEIRRLRADPPEPIFDEDEVFDWVVEHLPDIVAATLTADDVTRILDFQVEFFGRRGVSVNLGSMAPDGRVVIGGPEAVEYIVERCAATGEEYLPEQVEGVIETQAGYLRAIGAVGAEADAEAAAKDGGDENI